MARLSKAVGGGVTVHVERGYENRAPLYLWILVIAALAVGLGATGLAMALAAAEIRPDLATLAAVGASPRTRRAVGAAQAGVIVVIGSTLGVSGGLLLGWVLVLAGRSQGTIAQVSSAPTVPWVQVVAVLVGLPLLAMAGGFFLTRSRLPVTRRLAT